MEEAAKHELSAHGASERLVEMPPKGRHLLVLLTSSRCPHSEKINENMVAGCVGPSKFEFRHIHVDRMCRDTEAFLTARAGPIHSVPRICLIEANGAAHVLQDNITPKSIRRFVGLWALTKLMSECNNGK